MKIILIALLFFCSSKVFSQSAQWTWINGQKYMPQLPVYGKKGEASFINNPGSRVYATSWTDTSGNLWVFGGSGSSSNDYTYLNDFWKFSPSSDQWTWVSGDSIPYETGSFGIRGVANISNHPCARKNAMSWKDNNGDFWLFGGHGYISGYVGYLNDLWKFSPSTKQWTWMSGDSVTNMKGIYSSKEPFIATGMPGARSQAVTWTDGLGNLWLFGGSGFATNGFGCLSDLWKYTPATNQWTWVNGDSTISQKGTFGTKGLEGIENKPGGRSQAVSWTDTSGKNFWLFGGIYYSTSDNGLLNDLWEYNVSTGKWTWMSGDTSTFQPAIYGTKGIAAVNNKPSARIGSAGWIDSSNNLWIFGGDAYVPDAFGSGHSVTKMNDLWKYSISTGAWTWVNGDQRANLPGMYGVKNRASSSSNPGGRFGTVSWKDPSGNFWLYSGDGNTTDGSGKLNDVWKYSPSTDQWTWMNGDNSFQILGIYGTQGVATSVNQPGARYGSVSWPDSSGNLWFFGGDDYANNRQGLLNDLWKYNTLTKSWTWVNGDSSSGLNYQLGVYGFKEIAAAANRPGGRSHATSWKDMSGNLWLFGGQGHNNAPKDVDMLNDLWKYTLSTGEWTWMNGDNIFTQFGVYGQLNISNPANKPGPRLKAMSWTDFSGNLWLFGGVGDAASSTGCLNDLWKYSPLTRQWTWMNGDSTADKAGSYGTISIPNKNNKPGARFGAATWSDSYGNLWLFGGNNSPLITRGSFNDLWKYNPSNGQWTWMSGDTSINTSSVYGMPGVPAINNKPGGRVNAVSWTDSLNNLWLFGGGNFTFNGTGYSNDLWKYNSLNGQWTWLGADSTYNQTGKYGVQGTPAPTNSPGSRQSSVSWFDNSGKLWLFGGLGYASNGSGRLNDLWQLTISNTALPVKFSSFKAQKQQQNVVLNWTTAQEQNSHYFVVERSAKGEVYVNIGKVNAMGTVSSATNYSFIDRNPLSGTNFYRLKQFDQDGKFDYSDTKKVILEDDASRFTIVQNPVPNNLQLKVQLLTDQKVTMQVISLNGHLLLSEERFLRKGRFLVSMNVEHLASGMYLINMLTETLNSSKKFIKQ